MDTRKTRKPYFQQLEKQKKINFRKSLKVPKKELSAGKTTLSHAVISYESGRLLFDQMKVSGRNAENQKCLNDNDKELRIIRLFGEVETRRERLKSALYLKLKKRKRLFFKKNLKYLISFLSENVA